MNVSLLAAIGWLFGFGKPAPQMPEKIVASPDHTPKMDESIWANLGGCQGAVKEVDGKLVLLKPWDFRQEDGDLDHWPYIRKSVLAKRARAKYERMKRDEEANR